MYTGDDPTPPPWGGGVEAVVAEGAKEMDEQTRQDLKQRLASAAGHIKGIERMVDQDAYCIDIIRQIRAVQAALDKISTRILDNHLHTCVISAIRDDDPQQREAVLREITSVFEMAHKR